MSKVESDSSLEKGSAQPDQNVAAVSKELFLSGEWEPKYINKIVKEGILVAGGLSAILLQVAEPGVGAGVNEHSNFVYRPVDRLRTTMTFVYCMAFGTPEEKRTIVDMVTKIHSGITGTLAEGRDKGKAYSALDPELQMWVAATLYATAVDLHARIFGPIRDEDEADRIYFEYSILACALQVPPEMWPPSRAAFWEYWKNKIATLEITEHARSVADDLLYLRKAPLYGRVAMPALRVLTAELLPERIRREYSVKRHPRTYKLGELALKVFYRPLPAKLRSMPINYFMTDMRKRLASRKKVFAKA